MKIMQIVSGAGINGAILHSLLLTRELVRRGHRLTMVCRPGAWIAERLADDPVELVESDLHRWPTNELRRIAALIGDSGVEVIHTHQSRAHSFGVLLRWLTGVPCVATAQSRHLQLHWMFNDYVVAVCEPTRRYHSSYNLVRPSRIETVPNFVDVRPFVGLDADDRRSTRQSFGIDGDQPLLVTVGSVVPRKGLRYLIRALPAVLAEARGTRLLVVGPEYDSAYAEEIRAEAERLDVDSSIIWAGHREDIHHLLGAADLFVLPSLEESLPLAILEAMAAGLPVVAAAVGGVPECVVDGVTGKLVPHAHCAALAEAITPLLASADLRRRMGDAGRTLMHERYSSAAVTPRIEAIFARLATSRAA